MKRDAGRRGPARRGARTASPLARLRARLAEAEATLEAIRNGEVDAFVVAGPQGDQTRAIEGATHPYHMLLNAMSDGAALLSPDGTILFGNRRLSEIARTPLERLPGAPFERLIAPAERPAFERLLNAGRAGAHEFTMAESGSATSVGIALSAVPLGRDGDSVLMVIVTDLTDRKRAEATQLGLMQRLISAEDDERRRIARELHDETGQSLTTLVVGLRSIADRTARDDVRRAAQRLQEVAAHTVDDVGRLARGLHPAVLDDKGLVAAARRHLSDFAKSFHIAVDLRVDGAIPRRLSPLVKTTLYRILQEALTNVARHAQARAVGVRLTCDGTMLELVIRDDGVGFDVDATIRDAAGLGLHGVQERTALLGGAIAIESRPERGTTIRVRIPVIPAIRHDAH